LPRLSSLRLILVRKAGLDYHYGRGADHPAAQVLRENRRRTEFRMTSNEPTKIRLLLADDHPLIRKALRDTLEKESDLEVVGEAANGAEAVELTAELRPDIVIMDVSMPVMNGVEATKRIKAADPLTLVLILTVVTDVNTIFNILQAGASGYLVKSIFGPEVVRTVRTLLDGDLVLAPDIAAELFRYGARHRDDSETVSPVAAEVAGRLSQRAIDILSWAARGFSNKEIAAKLGIAEATVKGYFVEIFTHLNVRSRTEAVFVSLKTGILNLDELG
jgi:DNA-binding NarL/FixJ family response regulator